MGLLRIMLALGVVLEHADYAIFVGSHTAVQIFFMISGFYMALMYGTRYQAPAPFYASRALRLLPTYWAALAICLLYSVLAHWIGWRTVVEYWQQSMSLYTWHDWSLYTLSNLLVLGSDWVWFTSAQHLTSVPHPVHLLVIPPVWTVSIELMFYLCCPWLARKSTKTLVFIASLTLIARIIAYAAGNLSSAPWHARFAPFEMMFFIGGMISARLYVFYLPYLKTLLKNNRVYILGLLGIYFILIAKFYTIGDYTPQIMLYGMQHSVLSLVLYISTFAALPIIFYISKSIAWDRIIGELSYPIYLMHYTFVVLFHHNNPFPDKPRWQIALLIVGLSVTHAVALYRWVQVPVDRYRIRRFATVLE